MDGLKDALRQRETLSAFVSIEPGDKEACEEFARRYGPIYHGDTLSDMLMWSGRFRMAWSAKTPADYDRISRYIEEVFSMEFPLGFASPEVKRIFVNFERGEMSFRPRCLLEGMARTLLKSEHLGICQNPECPGNKFFVAATYKQKYCTAWCSQEAQRQTKREWWAEHGGDWRSGNKKTQTKKGRKTR